MCLCCNFITLLFLTFLIGLSISQIQVKVQNPTETYKLARNLVQSPVSPLYTLFKLEQCEDILNVQLNDSYYNPKTEEVFEGECSEAVYYFTRTKTVKYTIQNGVLTLKEVSMPYNAVNITIIIALILVLLLGVVNITKAFVTQNLQSILNENTKKHSHKQK